MLAPGSGYQPAGGTSVGTSSCYWPWIPLVVELMAAGHLTPDHRPFVRNQATSDLSQLTAHERHSEFMVHSGMEASKWDTSRTRTLPTNAVPLHDLKADGLVSGQPRAVIWDHVLATVDLPWNGPIRSSLEVVNALGTQLSGVTASNLRRTSDVSTPRAPSSTAAGSGGWRARIWASTCWAET